MHNISVIISIIAYVVLFLNIVLYLYYLNFKSNRLNWFNTFLILGLITQITALIFTSQKINNLPLLHIYTLLEFIFLSLFYKNILKQEILSKKYFNILIISISISILIILNSIFLQNIYTFNSNAKTLTQVIYICYALTYFFNVTLEKTPIIKFLNSINAAILLYYAGSLFIFMFSNVFFSLSKEHIVFWVVNALLYLIFQLWVFIALWTFRQQTRTKSISL